MEMNKEDRIALQAKVVSMIFQGEKDHIKVEELDGGAGVFATHAVKFRGTTAYVASEDDAKTLVAAFTAFMLSLAVRFSDDLVNGRMFAGDKP